MAGTRRAEEARQAKAAQKARKKLHALTASGDEGSGEDEDDVEGGSQQSGSGEEESGEDGGANALGLELGQVEKPVKAQTEPRLGKRRPLGRHQRAAASESGPVGSR